MRFLFLLFFFTTAISGKALSNCINGNCSNGYGNFIFTEGEKYIGEWKDGKRHGNGVMKWTSPIEIE